MYKTNRKIPVNKEIKEKALLLSTDRHFKASKGWCDKFLKRNKNSIIQ